LDSGATRCDGRIAAKAAAHIVSWIYERRVIRAKKILLQIPKRHAQEYQFGNDESLKLNARRKIALEHPRQGARSHFL